MTNHSTSPYSQAVEVWCRLCNEIFRVVTPYHTESEAEVLLTTMIGIGVSGSLPGKHVVSQCCRAPMSGRLLGYRAPEPRPPESDPDQLDLFVRRG